MTSDFHHKKTNDQCLIITLNIGCKGEDNHTRKVAELRRAGTAVHCQHNTPIYTLFIFSIFLCYGLDILRFVFNSFRFCFPIKNK